MHRIILSETDERDLRFHLDHSNCAPVRLRCIAILMRGNGFNQAQIEQIFGAATSSQTNWARQWVKGGLKALVENGHQGRPSSIPLDEQQLLLKEFAAQAPATLAEARERIEVVSGQRFSLTGVRNFLRDKLKLRRRKAKQVPPRCDDPEKKNEQENWRKEKLEPLLEQASDGSASVWFVDAVHFTMLTGLSFLWSVLVCWVR